MKSSSRDAQIAERHLSDIMDRPEEFEQRQVRHLIGLLESPDTQARLSASWAIGLAAEHDPSLVTNFGHRLARAVESDTGQEAALRAITYIAEHSPGFAETVLSMTDLSDSRIKEAAPQVISGPGGYEPSGGGNVIGGGKTERDKRRSVRTEDLETGPETDADESTRRPSRRPRSPSSGAYPPDSPPSSPRTRPITFEEFDTIELLYERPWETARKVRYQAYGSDYPATLKQFNHSVSFGSSDGFDAEMRVWEGIQDHDVIPTVISWGEFPTSWIAYEHSTAGTLSDRSGAIPVDEALWILERVAAGIQYAHNYGVTHGGLTPDVIEFTDVLGKRDLYDYPKIADWGVARLFDDEIRGPLSRIPGHAAPEQIHPDRFGVVDASTDIYHLGVIAYQALTGRPPFVGETKSVLRNVLEADPNPVSEYDRSIPDPIGPIVSKCLAKRKVERYETVQGFRRELRSVRTGVR
ncbi:MAG: serine/threonine-protein kinase [Halobacteriota archaeon]